VSASLLGTQDRAGKKKANTHPEVEFLFYLEREDTDNK
jgi:hypothetical protein